MTRPDKAPVAVQRYGFSDDPSGGMGVGNDCSDIEPKDDGYYVTSEDYQRDVEAAKLEGIRLGLEAALKACEDERLEEVEFSESDVAYNYAIKHAVDAIRSLSIETILKGGR